MKLDLLEKVFTDVETLFYEEEVKEIAFLFLKCAKDNNTELGEDYWIQLGKEWDLNIYDGRIYGKENITKMTLYKILPSGKTDTLNDGIQLI